MKQLVYIPQWSGAGPGRGTIMGWGWKYVGTTIDDFRSVIEEPILNPAAIGHFVPESAEEREAMVEILASRYEEEREGRMPHLRALLEDSSLLTPNMRKRLVEILQRDSRTVALSRAQREVRQVVD